MGSVTDRWTKDNPAWSSGSKEPKRIRTSRWGVAPKTRYRAEWNSPNGGRHTASFPTATEANAHVEDQESDKRRGLYVAPNKVTVADLWPRWQTVKSSRARTTREGYDAAYKVYIEPRWADWPVLEIDRASVMEWLPTLRTKAKKPLSASWSRKVAITLSGILDMAVDGKLIPSNPLVKLGAAMPKQLPTERRYLTVAEVDTLIAASEKEGIDLAIRTLVMTGIRRGEMAGLQVGDLDAERGRLRISRDVDAYGEIDPTKTRRHRDVPVGGALLAELAKAAEGLPRSAPLLPEIRVAIVDRETNARRFTRTAVPWDRDSWRGRWDRASSAAGLTDLDTHELRHTAASLAIHAGANVKTVQRMLGHSSAAMTLDIYGHLWDDELDALPTAMDRHMTAERERAKAGKLTQEASPTHSPPTEDQLTA